MQDSVNFRLRRFELHSLSQRHAEPFIGHAVFNSTDGGLQYVGAGRALAGQPNADTIKHHRHFVLGTSQRNPQAVFSGQQGAMRQCIKQGNDFFVTQPLNGIIAGRHGQSMPGRQERHGSGAFATDVVQQRKVVLGNLALLRDQATHLSLWQQAGEEGASFVIVERLCLQR